MSLRNGMSALRRLTSNVPQYTRLPKNILPMFRAPRFNLKLILIFVFSLILMLNISASIIYHFHEPSKHKIDKVYKDYTGYKNVDDYRIHNIYEKDDLRYRLAKAFPYEKSNTPLQKNIWQLWKTKVFEELDDSLKSLSSSFAQQEAEDKGSFNYTLLANSEQSGIVKHLFEAVPEVYEAYEILPEIILKADFMRYLILFAVGGVYSDIDTSLKTDMQDWLTYNETLYGKSNQIGAVVAIESDCDGYDCLPPVVPLRLQYCQWTLQGKKGHPMYRELIARITEFSLYEYNPDTGDLHLDPYTFNMKPQPNSRSRIDAILGWTGPVLFTDVIFDYINEAYLLSEKLFKIDFASEKIDDPNRNLGLFKKVQFPKLPGYPKHDYDPITRPWGWENVTKQIHPIVVDDDLLLLPYRAFHLDYVGHHYKGSWKDE
jgi:alpha 1,6-mannosyltransferase